MSKKFKLFKTAAIGLCFLTTQTAHPWSGHGILFSDVLAGIEKSDPKAGEILNSKVQVESLNSFLLDTQEDLPGVLANVEQWSQKNEPAYQATPEALSYKPHSCNEQLENCFRRALRINTKVPIGFYVQDFENQHASDPVLNIDEYALPLTFYPKPPVPTRIKKVNTGDWISVKTVLTTHVEEPDFGMDINLYDDDVEHYSYGFGIQPIGVANNPLSSQALFHMSTYQETCFIKLLSPKMKQSYPAYRAHLYFSLAQFAKQKGHLYWSSRFAAWGFHYLQDLTQPYHSSLFPDYSLAQMSLWFAENGVGYKTHFENAKQKISNRHTLAEETLLHVMYDNLENKDRISLTVQEYAKTPASLDCKDISLFMRTVVSKNGSFYAPSFTHDLVDIFPAAYADDPNFVASNFTDYAQMYGSLDSVKKIRLTNLYLGRLFYFAVYSKQCLYDQVL